MLKLFRSVLILTITLLLLFGGYKIFEFEVKKKELKSDLIELSKIEYGLFNVDEWKTILADVITNKIEEFNLNDVNKDEMRQKISSLLYKIIDEFEENFYNDNLNNFSIKGFLKSTIAYTTGTFKELKKDVPQYSLTIIEFLNEEKNREAIRNYLIDKLNDYADNTFSETDYSVLNAIFSKYRLKNISETKKHISVTLNNQEHIEYQFKLAFFCLAILLLFIVILSKSLSYIEFLGLISYSTIFLVLGVLLPMIEIDARISEMTFTLLGEKITFSDQVLYYKNKSIIEVVQLMFSKLKIDLISVGCLVLGFSVIFPALKTTCSIIYLTNKSSRLNSFVNFMVFKSGKWSMADVMVVAIFMAFIGFDGIISEQLKQLENISKNVELLTTNHSNLLFGFFSFLVFVLLSLFMSSKMQKQYSTKLQHT